MRKFYKNFDLILAGAIAAVFLFGLLILTSASSNLSGGLSDVLVSRQAQSMAIGLIICAAIIAVDYRRFADLSYVIYVLNILLLLAVEIAGDKRLGAQRWLSIGGFGFQPSEFIKITFILALGTFLARRKDSPSSPSNLLLSCLILFPAFILIAAQPDLGTALLLAPIMLSMVFISGVEVKSLVILMATGLMASPFLWHFLKGYQKKRLLVFMNPGIDPLGAGYTIIQSKIAVGSGQLLGKGWLSGTQNQLNFLPERHTDFIFSVVGEEWGFIGAVALILLYGIIIYRGVKIIEQTNDVFGKLVATGIIASLGFQAIINIGMTLGLLPVVGVTLPFISYGGTSLITSMIYLGILLNIGARRPLF